ncbi:MAG: hypothetical protein KJ847_03690, partial [Firmicutes bacterium]|nr:hypothetical protein [Bacillota bacterium]
NSENYDWGQPNVFDVILNFDNNKYTSEINSDIKWNDTLYVDKLIELGQRNDTWESTSMIFAINFKEERVDEANNAGTLWTDLFDYSDQAAIYKQGKALGKMIDEVISFTGTEKVILVGHSMGGLAIREYLQRRSEIDGTHQWWSDNNNHKVARVVTIGTPHLGSNAWFEENVKSGLPNNESEALRDLKYSFASGNNGTYLFGGSESDITGFWNSDVNCDGDTDDLIAGISNGTTYNINLPLPLDIKYTWIVSDTDNGEEGGYFSGVPGDGCVLANKQWLYIGSSVKPDNVADTLMTVKAHAKWINDWIKYGKECDDYKSIIRGIDEPSSEVLAYEITDDIEYNGSITTQTSRGTEDIDCFKLENNSSGYVTVNIKANSSGANTYYLYENNNGTFELVKNATFSGIIQFSHLIKYSSDLYLKIKGTATANSFSSPYSFSMQISSPITISGYVKTSTGTAIPNAQFTGTNGITSAYADQNGYYQIPIPYLNWSGLLTPSNSSYTFNPVYKSYNNVTTSISNQNYVGTYSPSPNSPTIILTTPNNIQSNSTVNIFYDAEDSDSNADIYFYYDTDNTGNNGVCINPNNPVKEDNISTFFTWNVKYISQGTYWIYARITDGTNTVYSYSPGWVQVVGIEERDWLSKKDERIRSTSDGDLWVEKGESSTYEVTLKNVENFMVEQIRLNFICETNGIVMTDADAYIPGLDPGETWEPCFDFDIPSNFAGNEAEFYLDATYEDYDGVIYSQRFSIRDVDIYSQTLI